MWVIVSGTLYLFYNSLPMHAALVRAVLHVRTLFEKMRARVDLQISRYYIVLQYCRMSQPPWSNFRGGWRPRRPRGSYASVSACPSLSLSSLSLDLSLFLSLRLLCLSLFHAPTNALSVTGGRPMRLERACMSLLTNLKPVFIARSIFLYVSTYFLCQSKYFLTCFLHFWIVRDSLSLSFCACYPG